MSALENGGTKVRIFKVPDFEPAGFTIRGWRVADIERPVADLNGRGSGFGRGPREMLGMTMEKLPGPLYEKNLPYIRRALGGKKQVFERRIPPPNGEVRDNIATYTPDLVAGVVLGFRRT